MPLLQPSPAELLLHCEAERAVILHGPGFLILMDATAAQEAPEMLTPSRYSLLQPPAAPPCKTARCHQAGDDDDLAGDTLRGTRPKDKNKGRHDLHCPPTPRSPLPASPRSPFHGPHTPCRTTLECPPTPRSPLPSTPRSPFQGPTAPRSVYQSPAAPRSPQQCAAATPRSPLQCPAMPTCPLGCPPTPHSELRGSVCVSQQTLRCERVTTAARGYSPANAAPPAPPPAGITEAESAAPPAASFDEPPCVADVPAASCYSPAAGSPFSCALTCRSHGCGRSSRLVSQLQQRWERAAGLAHPQLYDTALM